VAERTKRQLFIGFASFVGVGLLSWDVAQAIQVGSPISIPFSWAGVMGFLALASVAYQSGKLSQTIKTNESLVKKIADFVPRTEMNERLMRIEDKLDRVLHIQRNGHS